MAQLFSEEIPALSKHLKTFSYRLTWMEIQLFPFWEQLPPMGKITAQLFTTLTQL